MPEQGRPLIKLKAGGVCIEVDYRRRPSDKGLRFAVFGGEEADAFEVLRFDCFEKRPHFHCMGPSGRKVERIDKKTIPDPVAWTVDRLRYDLRSLFWRTGRRKLAAQIDQEAVAKALAKMEAKIERLSRKFK